MSAFALRMILPPTGFLPAGPAMGAMTQPGNFGSRRLQPAQITHPEGCGYRSGNNLASSYAKTLLTSEKGFLPLWWPLQKKKEAIRTTATLLEELHTKATTFRDELNSYFISFLSPEENIASPWPKFEDLCKRVHHHKATLVELKLNDGVEALDTCMTEALKMTKLAFDGTHIWTNTWSSRTAFEDGITIDHYYARPAAPKPVQKKFRRPLTEPYEASPSVVVNLD